MTELIPESPPSSDTDLHLLHLKSLFGQPIGLWIAALTEFWVAAATYGMQAILLFYMQRIVLHPETIPHIFGATALIKLSNFLYHPPSFTGMAAAIMGMYLAALFAMPLLGAFFSDYFLGRNRAIILGFLLATAGLITLASPSLFVVSILLFLIGTGFVGCLKAQVGSLYSETDRRRSDAYQIYSLSIQIAVMFSPLLTSWVSETSWKYAFLLCAVGMSFAGLTYILGLKYLPAAPAITHKKKGALSSPKFTRLEKKNIALICVIMLLFAISAIPNMELNDGYLIWAEQAYNLQILNYNFPVSDLYSLDGMISTITAVLVLWFWQSYDKHQKPMGDMGKILIGTFIGSIGPLVLAYVSFIYPQPHQISLWWGILFHTINDFGFAMSTMIGLSLVSRLTPKSIATIMISFFWLHICLCNIIVGKLASLIETMSAVTFWLLHSGLSFIGFIGLLCIAIFCKNLLPKEKTA
ncbi:peptide MFS transporter [Acetobacteraceae bacterium]|nr:peptide MFS transporter [Acetobacteraceae bacterium]